MNDLLTPRADSAVLSEINITPFTDVLLVLLIIFMILAALLTPPGFERQFSQPGKSPAAATSQRIAVAVDRHGNIRFNGTAISVQGLYADMARAGARAHVSLYADTHSPYGIALRVLDAAKQAGIRDVAFVTQ
jgi:biopolymer transport protein ExbD